MTALCGWVSLDAEKNDDVVSAMGRALRVDARQSWAQWSVPGLAIGLLELDTPEGSEEPYAPAVTRDGRYHLWMAGEAYDGGGFTEVGDAVHSRTPAFRHRLLADALRRDVDAFAALDGEYHVVLWDAHGRTLVLLNDRFGSLPLYWSESPRGFAFASGVRGVLAAPGVRAEPDGEAIREAVTFGGFRLGDRTNVAAVKMLPGASVVTVRGGRATFRRYWRWGDVPPRPRRPVPELVEEAHGLWQRAVRRRLAGATRPGQTLSGGLDSRAILAEAAPHSPRWTALTYGVRGCDDARYARRAAEAAGVTWLFHPLYSGRDPDWLDLRSGYIQETDGLIQLGDLMHLETLPLQRQLLDVHLSGYVGETVSGPMYNDIVGAEVALARMPYYSTPVGLSWEAAWRRMEELIAALGGALPRFVVFEHKHPQSTNRWGAAWRPWLRVRRPFLDYGVFDFWQGLPSAVRGDLQLYERWLRARYPASFARIPNQRTGLPAGASALSIRLARTRRVAWRAVQPRLARLGYPARPRVRSYHADDVFWRTPDARARIEGTILGPESLSCEILGRAAVSSVVKAWFDSLRAPTQVIGALYVYERYHRDLPRHLAAARAT